MRGDGEKLAVYRLGSGFSPGTGFAGGVLILKSPASSTTVRNKYGI